MIPPIVAALLSPVLHPQFTMEIWDLAVHDPAAPGLIGNVISDCDATAILVFRKLAGLPENYPLIAKDGELYDGTPDFESVILAKYRFQKRAF